MKIEIEFTSSYNASLKIDGREMRVESKPGSATLIGLTSGEAENTIGGIIASKLYNKIAQAQQAWLEAEWFDVDIETWATLSKRAADAAKERDTSP